MSEALVRKELSKLPGVSRTWFEWQMEPGGHPEKTLVVEVTFDTDPNSPEFRTGQMDDIYDTVKDTLTNRTTMVVSRLRIVPAQHR